MADLQDYWNTGASGYGDVVRPGVWRMQSFTTNIIYDIESVKLLLYRVPWDSDGIITISIRATDEIGKPTGLNLCSGAFNRDELTTSEAGEWKEIIFNSPYCLEKDVVYAVIIGPAVGTGDLYWRCTAGGNPYSGGNQNYSYDAGLTWASSPSLNFDSLFETWGSIPEPETFVWPIVNRPNSYNPDKVYDPIAETWGSDKDILAAGGGRYKNQVVVIGHKKLYFGSL